MSLNELLQLKTSSYLLQQRYITSGFFSCKKNKKQKATPEHQFWNRFNVLFYLYSLCLCSGMMHRISNISDSYFALYSAEYSQWTLDGSIRRQINVVCVTTSRQCNAKWFQPYQPLLEESSQTPLSVKWSQNATSKQTSLVSQSAGHVKLFFCCLAVHKKNKSFFFFDFL